ncbi:hypothetical protein [Brachyspira pilosicoli]|uniref:hypothetical protein n=1 Tax=Brachyspira pilosicoli TaxID=52584 RepID=UPI00255C8F8A|nr:hypothetical protein [Brachyspira pilosicoli]
MYLYNIYGANRETIAIVEIDEKDEVNVNIKMLLIYLCLNNINIDDNTNAISVIITKNIVFISREALYMKE